MQFFEHYGKDKDIKHCSESNWENIMQLPSIIVKLNTLSIVRDHTLTPRLN